MINQTHPTEAQSWPAVAAFVVHLSCTPGANGRVEHVMSGLSTTFATIDELAGFMRETLARSNPCEGGLKW